MKDERRTYTLAEVAALTGWSRDAIRRKEKAGLWPVGIRNGRSVAYQRRWVDHYLDAKTQGEWPPDTIFRRE